MITDSTLQRTLAAANAFGEPIYLINLASLVLYLDIVLSVVFQASLATLRFDWVRTHVTVGGAIVFLLSYVFLKSIFLPQVQGIFYLVIGMRIDIWHNNVATRAGRRVSEAEWLEYSILTRNTPAYRELETRRKEMDDAKNGAKSSFCLAVLIVVDIIIGVISGDSIASNLFKFMEHLPRVAFWICAGSISVFALGLLTSGLLAPSFTDIWVPVRKKTLRDEIRRVLTEEAKQ